MSVLDNLHPTRRHLLQENHSLTTDPQGREVYVGLTFEESQEFYTLGEGELARRLAGEHLPADSPTELRLAELEARHQVARLPATEAPD